MPETILTQDVSNIVGNSFLDYAVSVITDRALPNIIDGLKPVQRNCRNRTDNLTEPIRRSDRFTVGTYPAGNDISTDITKYVLRDANGYPYGIDRDA